MDLGRPALCLVLALALHVPAVHTADLLGRPQLARHQLPSLRQHGGPLARRNNAPLSSELQAAKRTRAPEKSDTYWSVIMKPSLVISIFYVYTFFLATPFLDVVSKWLHGFSAYGEVALWFGAFAVVFIGMNALGNKEGDDMDSKPANMDILLPVSPLLTLIAWRARGVVYVFFLHSLAYL